MRIETKSVADLAPAPYNPRTITERALAGLTESIKRFGLVEPIIWNERTGHVVGGHQRLLVLQGQGIAETPVVVVELDEREEKALNVTLNNPHVAGDWSDDLDAVIKSIGDEDLLKSLLIDDLLQYKPSLVEQPAQPAQPTTPALTRSNCCLIGDCRELLPTLPENVFACCVTSPPYWGLRDYGVPDQIGLEETPEEYIATIVDVFRQVRRVLREDGTLWLNLGDSYGGSKSGGRHDVDRMYNSAAAISNLHASGIVIGRNGDKNLLGLPWRCALALQADGWILRSDIIWHKPNPMPESVTDRPTKAHEYVFLLAKSDRYQYHADAIAEPAVEAGRTLDYTGDQKANRAHLQLQRTLPRGRKIVVNNTRNSRTVWTIVPTPFSGAHFAVMPPALIERCILAGSSEGDAVLDPFLGSGTVGQVAESLGRTWIGCELNPEYDKLVTERLGDSPTIVVTNASASPVAAP